MKDLEWFLLFSVFDESKMNEVVAEIRLLKELQHCHEIGEPSLHFQSSRLSLLLNY